MKFNISLKVLPLLACGMLMASCNDFLKQEPLTDITPTDYYKDATQLQAVANAFYQTVLPYHSGAGYGTFAYDNGTDNQTGSDGDSKYKKGSWKTSNDNSSWSWNNIRDINYQLNIAQSNYENGLRVMKIRFVNISASYTSSVPMLISVFTRVSVTYLL